MHLAMVTEGEGHALDFGDRHHPAENAAHQAEELQLAGNQHIQRAGVRAGDVAVLRHHLDREGAPGLLRHRRPQIDQELVQVADGGLVVELAGAPAWWLRSCRADGGGGQRQRAPGHGKVGHGVFLLSRQPSRMAASVSRSVA